MGLTIPYFSWQRVATTAIGRLYLPDGGDRTTFHMFQSEHLATQVRVIIPAINCNFINMAPCIHFSYLSVRKQLKMLLSPLSNAKIQLLWQTLHTLEAILHFVDAFKVIGSRTDPNRPVSVLLQIRPKAMVTEPTKLLADC